MDTNKNRYTGVTHNAFFVRCAAFAIVVLFFSSCSKESSTEQPVTLEQVRLPFSPYDVPEGVGTENIVTGGVGKYTLTFIEDTSILKGYVRSDNVLYLKGWKKGSTQIEITDEAGNSSGKLSVDVKDFVVRPRSLDVPIRTSGGYYFNYGNYGVKVSLLDTTLAAMTYNAGGYVSFRGTKFGSTTVRFTGTQSQSVQEFPLNVVELRPAELNYSSLPLSFAVKNGHVTDRKVTLVLDRQRTLWIRCEWERNADTTIVFQMSPFFQPPVSAGDSSVANASLLVNGQYLHLFASKVLITSVNNTSISGTFKGTVANPADSTAAPVSVSGSFSGDFYTEYIN